MGRFRIAALLAVLGWCSPARALDRFEIQVYQGEHNAPGQVSLELHTNYTISGHAVPAYAGETPADRALRTTLEPAVGVTEWLELGAYLQGLASPGDGAAFGGWKLRAKGTAPARLTGALTLGLNVELGHLPHAVEQDGWTVEIRPIVRLQLGPCTLAVNPVVGFALTGSAAFAPDLEPAIKGAVDTGRGVAFGLEYYAGLGRLDEGLSSARDQEHLLFATLDLAPAVGAAPGPWEVNVGVGRALTQATPQEWIVKTILGRSF